MTATYFNVSSVTNAMRGKNILEHNGIRAYVSRTVDENGENGCGYSISVNDDPDRAEKLLKASGIRMLGRRMGERL